LRKKFSRDSRNPEIPKSEILLLSRIPKFRNPKISEILFLLAFLLGPRRCSPADGPYLFRKPALRGQTQNRFLRSRRPVGIVNRTGGEAVRPSRFWPRHRDRRTLLSQTDRRSRSPAKYDGQSRRLRHARNRRCCQGRLNPGHPAFRQQHRLEPPTQSWRAVRSPRRQSERPVCRAVIRFPPRRIFPSE